MQQFEKEVFYKHNSYSHSRPEKFTRFKKECGCILEIGIGLNAELFPCKEHINTRYKKGSVCIACHEIFPTRKGMKEHRYSHAV